MLMKSGKQEQLTSTKITVVELHCNILISLNDCTLYYYYLECCNVNGIALGLHQNDYDTYIL